VSPGGRKLDPDYCDRCKKLVKQLKVRMPPHPPGSERCWGWFLNVNLFFPVMVNLVLTNMVACNLR